MNFPKGFGRSIGLYLQNVKNLCVLGSLLDKQPSPKAAEIFDTAMDPNIDD